MWGARAILIYAALVPSALTNPDDPKIAPGKFVLYGVCDALYQDAAGLTFECGGRTKNDSPVYKSTVGSFWIYYDKDCGAKGQGTPRWILDKSKPSFYVKEDLDQDGLCTYLGRYDSLNTYRPPKRSEWIMRCDGEKVPRTIVIDEDWTNQLLNERCKKVIEPEEPVVPEGDDGKQEPEPSTSSKQPELSTSNKHEVSSSDDDGDDGGEGEGGNGGVDEPDEEVIRPPKGVPESLVLNGACQMNGAVLEGKQFNFSGMLKDGSPWYTTKVQGQPDTYLFYDRDCDGPNKMVAKARWTLDGDIPGDTDFDHDNDEKCDYYARTISEDWRRPPTKAEWKMYCISSKAGIAYEWKKLEITLLEPEKIHADDEKEHDSKDKDSHGSSKPRVSKACRDWPVFAIATLTTLFLTFTLSV